MGGRVGRVGVVLIYKEFVVVFEYVGIVVVVYFRYLLFIL